MSRFVPSGAALGAAAIVIVSLVAGTAFAYFTGNGGGTASAAVSKLTAPTLTATPAAGGTVSLSWTAASAPGETAVAYFVRRDGAVAEGNCPTAAEPGTGTSCVDRGVPIGNHEYTVTAVWGPWQTTSAVVSGKVTIGEATHFSISASATTIAAGGSTNLTIAAKDENNATVTTFTGSHTLVFGGIAASPGGTNSVVVNSAGTSVNLGASTALTFTSGQATVASSRNGVLKPYRAGSFEVTATEGALTTTTPLALTVNPTTTTKFNLAAESAAPVAGVGDGLTIRALDAYSNPTPAYAGIHNLVFSGASAAPNGTVPTVVGTEGNPVDFGTSTPIEFVAGVATATAGTNGTMRLTKTGSTTVKAAEGTTVTTLTSAVVTVAGAPAVELLLTSSTGAATAGTAVAATLTAKDEFLNVATSYTGAKSIVYSGAVASPAGIAPTVFNSAGTAVPFGTATSVTFTSGVAVGSTSKNGGIKLTKAEATEVVATDGSLTTAPLAFTVAVGAASKLAMTGVIATPGSVPATCFFTCPVTGVGNAGTITASVAVTDSSGNQIQNLGSGHTVNVTVTSGGTITGSPLTIAATGPALSTTALTYKSPTTGTFTHTITAATPAGQTAYGSATITATK